MSSRSTLSAAGAALSLALAVVAFGAPSAVHAQDAKLCAAPTGVDVLEHPPMHIRERIAKGMPLKIVAIGSSSTFGAGASSPAGLLSEPARGGAEGEASRPAGDGAQQGDRRRGSQPDGRALRCRRDRRESGSRAVAGRQQLGAARSPRSRRDHPAGRREAEGERCRGHPDQSAVCAEDHREARASVSPST